MTGSSTATQGTPILRQLSTSISRSSGSTTVYSTMPRVAAIAWITRSITPGVRTRAQLCSRCSAAALANCTMAARATDFNVSPVESDTRCR